MAGKRTATTELNHDNWNDEYEPDEAGTFKRASEDVIQRRVIKTARRRNPISSSSSNNETSAKNVFSNFGGFGKTTSSQTQSSSSSPFAFLGNMTNNTQSNSNGLNSATSVPSTTTLNKSNSVFNMPDKNLSGTSIMGADAKKNSPDKSLAYYAKLKGLNESVSQWIKTHVDKNPFCILTPIFKDYEKYLAEIESQKGEVTEQTSSASIANFKFSSEPNVSQSASHTSSIFAGTSAPKSTTDLTFLSKPNSESKPVDAEKTSSTSSISSSTFSFSAAPKTSTTSTTGFTFGTGAPFAFANVAKPVDSSSSEKKEEVNDEDEPPKAEFKPVVEDGSVFSKRCKVFVKKDGAFGDRGVGQLFLKPVAGSEKIQLIVRADTNLGNLLLNFILSESMPMQRMGKNNVMLVCIPTPEAKPPPTPILLRVKTSEEADELLKVLETHKK